EVLLDGGERVDTGVIGHEARDPADLTRLSDHRAAADEGVAPLRSIQRREDPHRRRLAGTVRPDESQHLTALDAERHLVDGADAVEVPHETVEAQHRLAHGTGSTRPSTR